MDDQPKSVGVKALSCTECERCWTGGRDRWRAYLTDDDLPELVFYCGACAEREFGP